ncbi:MAG: type II toxin-antitoxin system RelE/ParE family toxin [Pseudohongiellaceae bacterium]
MVAIHITERATLEIQAIEEYSKNRWGEHRATRYISGVDEALTLLSNHPNLLQTKSEISAHLKFYLSGEHILVFAQFNDDIYLITVMHSRMNLSHRIQELEPTLRSEVEIMHNTVLQNL